MFDVCGMIWSLVTIYREEQNARITLDLKTEKTNR
jgi:hypothetical protein